MNMRRMTAAQARAHLARLELSQQGLARLIDRNPVTVRRWLDPAHPNQIPIEIGIMLELLTLRLLKRYQV
jgi:hypothetical protein